MSFKKSSPTVPLILCSGALLGALVLWSACASSPVLADSETHVAARVLTPTPTNSEAAPVAEAAAVPLAAQAPTDPPTIATPAAEESSPAEDHRSEVSTLTDARCYALGMIETGNEDDAVGGAGEVSRYQIMPSVWQHYNSSSQYRDPKLSRQVAREHWTTLYDYFKRQAGREPGDFDMYVLWNTRQGYYAGRKFDPARLSAVIRDRAQRFTNLLGEAQRRDLQTAAAMTQR
jgi:hypothetical protein